MSLEQRLRRDARRLAGDPEAAALFECLRPHFLNPDQATWTASSFEMVIGL